MSAVQRGASAAEASVRGRTFRPAWSLAAGTGLRARLNWFAVAAAATLPLGEIRRVTFAPNGDVDVSHPFVVALPSVLAAWLVWSVGARPWRRRAGERRRRERGGGRWWLDGDWPAGGAERKLAAGLRGPSVAVASALVATLAYCALGLSMLGRMPRASWVRSADRSPELWGWAPATAWVVVAAWALPLLWWLIVVGPRLGRGRLLVSWPTLPQFTGTRCAFHVGTSSGGARIDGARVFLRCVRMRTHPLLPLANLRARLAWVGEAHLRLGTYVGPQSHLVAEFDVPANAPPTDLNADDAVRWELLVLGTVGGTDYADAVIVPVYAPAA